MSNPLVTVWLTSYNQGKYLRESIDSVLNQTFKDFELIICDDCSTDDSWEIIQSYDDPRIEKRRNEVNTGAHVTYETIDACRGKYIAVHHSDDVWEPDKLEKQVAFMEGHSEYAACFTKVNFIDENSNIWELPEGHIHKRVFEQENRTREEWINYFFYKGNCLCHPSLLIRKIMYRQYNLLDDYGLVQFPDFNSWIKICLHENIYVYPEYLIRFRIRRYAQDNVSADRADVRIRCQYEFTKIYKNFCTIDNKEDMLKIFPETKIYLVNGEMNVKYALAQLFFKIKSPSAEFVALNLLYGELDNPDTRRQIENLYNFDYKSFIKCTAFYDVFFMNRYHKYTNTQLFIDMDNGEGICEKNSIKKMVYVRPDGFFNVEFDLSAYDKIKQLRFDPSDRAVKVKLTNVNIGGEVLLVSDSNALPGRENEEYDVFATDDPMYYFYVSNVYSNKFSVSGFIKNIDTSFFYNMCEVSNREKEILLREKAHLKEEINSIKSTKGYRLLEFIREFRNKFIRI